MPAKNTICLWYDGAALDAAKFYAETFPNSALGAVHRAPADYPSGKQGDVLTVEFVVMEIPCLGINGDPFSDTAKLSLFRLLLTIRQKRIGFGTRLLATMERKVPAAGVKTDGESPGRSLRAF